LISTELPEEKEREKPGVRIVLLGSLNLKIKKENAELKMCANFVTTGTERQLPSQKCKGRREVNGWMLTESRDG